MIYTFTIGFVYFAIGMVVTFFVNKLSPFNIESIPHMLAFWSCVVFWPILVLWFSFVSTFQTIIFIYNWINK